MIRRALRMASRPYRRWLRRMRYYSAPRQRSRWLVARDVLLLATMVLAVPVMLVTELLVTRPYSVMTRTAELFEPDAGSFRCVFALADAPVESIDDHAYGDVTLHVMRARRGWPFPTRQTTKWLQVDLNVYNEPGRQSDAQLAADAPLRAAIEAGLATIPDGHELVTLWDETARADAHRLWPATVAAASMWWVILMGLAVVGLVAARIGAILLYAHEIDRTSRRLAQGHCEVCDYDLRGLEYSAHCPECGTILE